MTDAVSLKPDLGRFGAWLPTRSISPELAAGIESLGYRVRAFQSAIDFLASAVQPLRNGDNAPGANADIGRDCVCGRDNGATADHQIEFAHSLSPFLLALLPSATP